MEQVGKNEMVGSGSDGADERLEDKNTISNPEAIDSGAEWMFQTFDH